MKTRYIVLAFLLAALAAAPLFAQQAPLKVSVPFDFVVENLPMGAGEYTIEPIVDNHILIRSADGKAVTTILSFPKRGQVVRTQAQVVFHRYGKENFLAEIWTPGSDSGRELVKGKRETAIRRQGGRQEIASLAARQSGQ